MHVFTQSFNLWIAVQVEAEEEYMVNTLQKKLAQLKHEKVDLENQLEAEQEYIVHKLQKNVRARLYFLVP